MTRGADARKTGTDDQHVDVFLALLGHAALHPGESVASHPGYQHSVGIANALLTTSTGDQVPRGSGSWLVMNRSTATIRRRRPLTWSSSGRPMRTLEATQGPSSD